MSIQMQKDKPNCSSTMTCGRSLSLFADARPQTTHPWKTAAGSNWGCLQRSIIKRKGIYKQHSRQQSSESGDKYEREADRAANRIMRRSSPVAQMDPKRELREPSSSPLRSYGGIPLPESSLDFFEPRFGCNLSPVRIHADQGSDRMSRALGAEAFAIGSDIYFRSEAYNPGSWRGRELLAHELAHVLQQSLPVGESRDLSHAPRCYPMCRLHPEYSSIDIEAHEGLEGQHFYFLMCEMISQIENSPTGHALMQRVHGYALQGRRIELIEGGSDPCIFAHHPDKITITIPPVWTPIRAYWDIGVPKSIHLAHEFIHALHHYEGRHRGHTLAEEWATIGLARFAGEMFTENRIRCELGLPMRTSHDEDPRGEEIRLMMEGFGLPVCFQGIYTQPPLGAGP